MWFVSLKVLEATFCAGVKTKRQTRNPVCLRETPVKVCGVCAPDKKSQVRPWHITTFWSRCKILACEVRASAETFSSPLFFRFSCLIFFSCWAFSRLHFGGQWNKIFMEIFGSMLHGFVPFSPVSLTELYSFWYGLKDLFTLHKLADKVVLDR